MSPISIEEARRRAQRAYREANKEKVAGYQRAYHEANKEKVAAMQRENEQLKRMLGL
jgi:hypothetical protein